MTRTAIAVALIALSATAAAAQDRYYACEGGTSMTYDDSSRSMVITGVIEGFNLALPEAYVGNGSGVYAASTRDGIDACGYDVAPCAEYWQGPTGEVVTFYVLDASGPVVNCTVTDANSARLLLTD